jgi:hypothetical protein
MSTVKISFIKKTATIEMKLTLEQMGLLEEALQHIAECTPDDKIGPIENLAEMFGFDFSDILLAGKSGEIEIIGGHEYVHKVDNGLSGN